MPLMNWDDWTPDRLHWTFPAVVHAFPRCLYDVADTTGPRSSRPTGGVGGKGAPRLNLDPSPADAAASGAAAAVAGASPAAGAQGIGGMLEVEGDWGMGRRGEGAEGSPAGDNGESAEGKETPQNRPEQPQEQTQRGLETKEEESEAGAEAGAETKQADDASTGAGAAEAAGSTPPLSLPSPFKPFTLGEVYIRTAPAPDVALAGVGAGPWRRRWLVLRQTYVFELLQPPAPSTVSWGCDSRGAGGEMPSPTPLCPPSGAAASATQAAAAAVGGSQGRAAEVGPESGARGGEDKHHNGDGGSGGGGGGSGAGGQGDDESSRRKVRKIERTADRDKEGSDRYVAPVGFMCLSKASVGYGGINWGPKTLLLR